MFGGKSKRPLRGREAWCGKNEEFMSQAFMHPTIRNHARTCHQPSTVRWVGNLVYRQIRIACIPAPPVMPGRSPQQQHTRCKCFAPEGQFGDYRRRCESPGAGDSWRGTG